MNAKARAENHLQIAETISGEPITLLPPFCRSNLYSITETQKPEGVVSELYNFAASRVDNGLFECVAGNAYGSATLNSQVLVEEVADSPHDFQAAEIGSRDITLKWSIPFSGNSPITKYSVEWKRDKGMIYAAEHAAVDEKLPFSLAPLSPPF